MSDSTLPHELRPVLADALLAGADDDLLAGHAASDWTGLAPMLEEDIAFSSIAQDEIAHAREVYTLVGELTGRPPDAIAYGRPAAEYRCASLTYAGDEFDWAALIARQFYYDHFDALRLEGWSASAYMPLAHLARRIAAEETFHVHHVDDWVLRLTRGSEAARDNVQAALERLWPLTAELFESTAGAEKLAQAGVLPRDNAILIRQFHDAVESVWSRAGLKVHAKPIDPSRLPAGGRCGKHSPSFAALLDELCEVYRLDPQAVW